MELDRYFSAADREAVEAAVRGSEGRTSGEIVPFVVDRSDDYPNAVWKGAALGALIAPLLALALYRGGGFWGEHLALWIALPALAGGALGFLLARFLPPLRRALAGRESCELRCRRRAAVAFLECEVFKTAGRTGILVFVSIFEHQVVVLADSGIHASVPQSAWDAIAGRLAASLRQGERGPALARAIRECGELLARQGVARAPDDVNELPDTLQRRRD